VSTPIPTNRAPFSAQEILASTGGSLKRLVASDVVGVGTDTRQDLSGKVFVTLSGPNFDGHAFLEQAVARGAAILLVAAGRGAAAPASVTVIEVPDPLAALGALAAFHRRRFGGRVVAVAGSAGKTTTRSTIGRLLEALFPGQVHTTVGNLNNRVGVPLTLLGLEPHHELAVVEVGTPKASLICREWPGRRAPSSKLSPTSVWRLVTSMIRWSVGACSAMRGVVSATGKVPMPICASQSVGCSRQS
jgi:UDP-N-acetylmuramoyl-tripeptide--D-alanyl-D-alanine ligase